MPHKKSWKKSECQRAVLNRGRQSERICWVKESPDRQKIESPVSVDAQSPVSVQAQSPANMQARIPVSVQAHSPVSMQARSPVSMQAQSPVSMQANESESQIVHESENMKSKFTQFQCKQAQPAQFQHSSLTQIEAIDLVDNPLANADINVLYTELVLQSPKQSWNACHILFGSFHQNDRQFSEHSRGFQCTGNALCMLSYLTCFEIDNSSTLDKVLYDGDALCQTIINNLNADGKFIHSLLSLDEHSGRLWSWDWKIYSGKTTHCCVGILLDTHEEHGLPTLHFVLNSTLTCVSSTF